MLHVGAGFGIKIILNVSNFPESMVLSDWFCLSRCAFYLEDVGERSGRASVPLNDEGSTLKGLGCG